MYTPKDLRNLQWEHVHTDIFDSCDQRLELEKEPSLIAD